MKKKHPYRVILLCYALFAFIGSMAQEKDAALPITDLPGADTSKPLVFYVSGDGGWNKFSNAFMNAINKQGYPVLGLNAREYFWHKKETTQMAKEISGLLSSKLKTIRSRGLVVIGYSFGADVMPFMVTRFTQDIRDKLNYIVLMSPSPSTDFEIHVADMLGIGRRNGVSVTEEINKVRQRSYLYSGKKKMISL